MVLVVCVDNIGVAYADRVNELIEQFKSKYWRARIEANYALGKIGDKRAIKALKEVALSQNFVICLLH
jgi:HEAT repeat protein